ncbi:hypothetical protein SY83_19820 [Paenibacillus swuensis]|uniref:Pyridoxamine 5'-phosphate oxidase N-terminal domain-containing protein n=1 Tax=Paenibacillus swuensis TaxID=1178515 RepID=A0A172TMH0_9BACL|nr:pyridoxamine 5'-phosphate oxidase family protein [Paenibacillus swuensis]ANE48166.1 hypothetical protein SY83_19820 [Paenibacillus swuensis]
MGKEFTSITPQHEDFIRKQNMFFVGSAAADGEVNISPKGHDVFRILSPNQVAYLDLTGSGNETSAHLTRCSRLTFMFVSFEGDPLIMRLYGDGEVILPETPAWDAMSGHFNLLPGARQIIVSNIHKVKTSCGFSIPFFHYEGERNKLIDWAAQMGESKLNTYRATKNAISMDGIPTPLGIRNESVE